MQHDNGQRLGISRDLIEGVEMVSVETLAFGGRRVVVVGSRIATHRPANREATLFQDRQWLCFRLLISHCARGGEQSQTKQDCRYVP